MTSAQRVQMEGALDDKKLIEATLRRAVRKALLQHRRAGNPVAIWKDGQVVWIAPADIKVSDEP